MSEEESIAFPFYITFEDHHSRVLVDELVCCQETFPPKSIDSSKYSLCLLLLNNLLTFL